MPEQPAAAVQDRVLVALDVERLDEADALLERLEGAVGGCKIGSQLFTAAGPVAIEHALKRGYRVFLDLKYHDIPEHGDRARSGRRRGSASSCSTSTPPAASP